MKKHIAQAEALIEALPYIQQFRGQTFLIKIGGAAMEEPRLVSGLLRDIVFLEAVGINPVIVHGGGKAISAAMKNAGLSPNFISGMRVTDEASIKIVEATLSEGINPELVNGILALGGRAVGIPGKEVFQGRRLPGKDPETGGPVDLGFVGEAVEFSLGKIEEAVAKEIVPVVSPIAREIGTGVVLNVNADLAASALGARLKAAKIIYLSDVLGVMRDPKEPATLIPTLDRREVDTLIRGGVISGGMIPKVMSALDALSAGVGKIHMIDGRVPHSLLLEVFTSAGIGTEIVPEKKNP